MIVSGVFCGGACRAVPFVTRRGLDVPLRRAAAQGRMWMQRARLWRFVLLQRPDGCARRPSPLPQPSNPRRHTSPQPFSLSTAAHYQRSRLDRRSFFDCTEGIALALCAQLHSDVAGGLGGDCPVTFQAEAVRQTVPEITFQAGESELNDEEGKLRIWTTALAVAALERLGVSWLADAQERITVVDRAAGWLMAQAIADAARPDQARTTAAELCGESPAAPAPYCPALAAARRRSLRPRPSSHVSAAA